MVARHLGKWKSDKISEITKEDVTKLHDRIGADSGRIAANRVIQLVRRMFNWAIDARGWEGANPANRVKCFPERCRKRFLQPDEVPAFLDALAKEPKVWRDFFGLAFLTGARRANLQSMEWPEVNFATGLWTIPGSKFKNGEEMSVPLLPQALDILRNRKASSAGHWVFPGQGKSGHVIEPKSALQRICARADIKDFRFHDCRRTHGAYQAAAGSSLTIIGASLGHRSTSATKVYAQLYLQPIRESVEKGNELMMTFAKAPRSQKLLGDTNG